VSTAGAFGIGLWALLWIVVGIAVVVAVVMSFFVRRHGEQPSAQAHWMRTDEVFVDPTTDRLMRVWVEPGTGVRHYVPEAPR
jgi:hypothetical protein